MIDSAVLERRITIGFENSLSLEKRHSLINSDLKLSRIFDLLEKEPKELQAKQCVKWLSDGLGDVIWFKEKGFPVYSPIERNLPYMLFYKGKRPSQDHKITIVGTRYATENALQKAFCLGLEAQVNSICVVSGLAHGIDQAASRGALSVIPLNMKCNTIGVLGCGLEVDYPAMTGVIKDKILSNGGTLISQFAPSEPGLKQNFPNRNLTMAALSEAVIIVQAPEKSGALITGEFALEMGKDIYIAREGIEKCSKNLGSIQFAEDGAKVISTLSDVYKLRYNVIKTEKPIRPFARYGECNYTVLDNDY